MRGRYIALGILGIVASLSIGIALERFYLSGAAQTAGGGPKILYWVAPMDPNFRRDGPGKSPMGMDLVPVYEGVEKSGDPAEVEISGSEINAIGVRTAISRVEEIAQRIDTVGFVKYNEHLTSHIHVRVEGWIEYLNIRAIGDRVKAGELLFTVYSPDVAIASADLISAVRRNSPREIESSRIQLRNFGVSSRQIDEMAAATKPAQNFRVYAPRDGIVIALEAADGMYLKPEVRAMSIADLSAVWILVDVFERDIGRLTEDKRASARFEHLPGRLFEGEIDYIYPELDATTRTLPIRLLFDNSDGVLRPNMFGSVTLVPQTTRQAITVPSEAVIRTGRAERVILKTGVGTFKPRLVTTGLTDSFGQRGRTEIVQGLTAGEEVVASAQFLIDSESALGAGLIRMAPTQEAPAAGSGTLVAMDPKKRQVTIRHERLEALDWPAMETRFALLADTSLAAIQLGEKVKFSVARGADGLLSLIELRPDNGVDATGTGLVHAITPDGKLTLSHDPIPELGWPAMQMDMPVADFDPADAPLDTPIQFDLLKGDDGLFTVIALRPIAEETGTVREPDETAGENDTSAPMRILTTSGKINSIDLVAGKANVTHGPLVEIGMPGMTMDFTFAPQLNRDLLREGEAELQIAIDASGTFLLAGAELKAPAMRVVGQINSVDVSAGKANITHGPLVEIGMPGMTMDFPIADGLNAQELPVGIEVRLILEKGSDLSLTLSGIEEIASQ